MKSSIFDVSGNPGHVPYPSMLRSPASYSHIRKMVGTEQTVKGAFYEHVLQRFEEKGIYDQEIPLDKIHEYGAFTRAFICLLYTGPALRAGVGLGPQLSVPEAHYLLRYHLCMNYWEGGEDKRYMIGKRPEDYHRERLQLVYSFILKRMYNFEVPVKTGFVHAGVNTETGLLEYYSVNINTDFIDVTINEELPVLDCSALYTHLSAGASYEILETMLPLNLFRFRGIAMLKRSGYYPADGCGEYTSGYVLAVQPMMRRKPEKRDPFLKTLVRSNKIEFDLFPFVRVNNEPVYGFVKGGTGVLFAVWGENNLTPKEFSEEAKYYAEHPEFFFSQDIFKTPGKRIR